MVKSHGGERLGKVTAETVAGVAQRDECKRTIDEASKISLTRSKLGSDVRSRMSLGEPVYCLSGLGRRDGVTLS
jgi:hypothetical protein